MSWAADGQDGNGLHLEKMRLNFKFNSFCLGKCAKTQIMVFFLFEKSLDLFLFVFCKHFVYDKGI